MKANDQYIVIYHEGELVLSKEKIAFFDTKEELNAFITSLYETKTKLNQRLTDFACVFKKGSLLPTDSEGRRKVQKTRTHYHTGNGYFVQRTKKKKTIWKSYNFIDDFDWQIPEWEEKGYRDFLILDFDEALSADYYYKCDIAHVWGEKEALFA